MNTIIKVIEHHKQRYKTVGDWKFINNIYNDFVLDITISDLGDSKMNCLIAIHEFIEAILCKFNDPEITTEQVDKFDLDHPELEEPGESTDCPYMVQHLIANSVEIMMANILKVNWDEFERKVKSL